MSETEVITDPPEIATDPDLAWWGSGPIPYVNGKVVTREQAGALYSFFRGTKPTDWAWRIETTADEARKEWLHREEFEEDRAIQGVAHHFLAFCKEVLGSAASGIEFKTPEGETVDRVGGSLRALFTPGAAIPDGIPPRLG